MRFLNRLFRDVNEKTLDSNLLNNESSSNLILIYIRFKISSGKREGTVFTVLKYLYKKRGST